MTRRVDPSARARRALPHRFAALGLAALLGVAGALDARADEPATPGESADDTADAIFATLAETRSVRASFVETKRMALLKHPLVTEGTLVYAAPGRLAMTTRDPASALLLDGQRMVVVDAGQTDSIDLAGQPSLRQLVQAFREVLAGNASGIAMHYSTTATRDGEQWRLTLVPRAEDVRAMVASIDVSGTAERVERLVITEGSGDVTETTFSDHAFDLDSATVDAAFAVP